MDILNIWWESGVVIAIVYLWKLCDKCVMVISDKIEWDNISLIYDKLKPKMQIPNFKPVGIKNPGIHQQ